MYSRNETHDPDLRSWVTSANKARSDFPIQNLPFAIFKGSGDNENSRAGVAIGDQIVDLTALRQTSALDDEMGTILASCAQPKLNAFMALGRSAWSGLRLVLSNGLRVGSDTQAAFEQCLVPRADVEFSVPARIGDYTDFYTSIGHATNVGKLFRPDNPLLPNYQWIPIGYHGRSSSIAVSGQHFHRPRGQLKPPTEDVPTLAATKQLDYELEVGIYIGEGNELGFPIALEDAEDHVFGLCLFNDWSARDIQAWEYQPLGPFLGKSFASTVSPWIITLEALVPYRSAWTRPVDRPQPLSYLASEAHSASGALDMNLEVLIQTKRMRAEGSPPNLIAESNFLDSYWSIAQMVTHHTVNGCNLTAGDFFGSGTQSGNGPDRVGSLLEKTRGGEQPVKLNNGEQRAFLEDGDSVIMRGYCMREGAVRIGFGEAVGTVLPNK